MPNFFVKRSAQLDKGDQSLRSLLEDESQALVRDLVSDLQLENAGRHQYNNESKARSLCYIEAWNNSLESGFQSSRALESGDSAKFIVSLLQLAD